MTSLLLAFQFLTAIPIRLSGSLCEKDLAGSMRYYPLVGAILGGGVAFLYVGVLRYTTLSAAVVTAVVGLIGFSRALHLEGFADLCDGFYAGHTKERILAIMKDSHIGAMGVIGIACLLALKIGFFASLMEERRVPALIIAPALARWVMVFLSATSTYARAEGTGSPYIGHLPRSVSWIAMLFALLFSWWTFQGLGLALFAAATAFAWVFKSWVYRHIEGMTGDTLGAAGELAELLTWVLLSLHRVVAV